jgi:hypothetical protein
MRPLPDEEKVVLRISTIPTPSLVRRLAVGEEVRAQVHISSKGLALTSLIEKLPASGLSSHFAWTNLGMSSIPVVASLCLFLITLRTLYTRRLTAKERVARNPQHDSLTIRTGSAMNHTGNSHNHSYSNGSESPTLPRPKGFVYDFRNEFSGDQHKHSDVAGQKPSWSMDNMVLLPLQRIVQAHQTAPHAPTSMIETRTLSPLNNEADRGFQDWWNLGRDFHQSIMAQDSDTSILDTLHQRIEQQGIWVTPFIASALTGEIQPDILLGYSLKLCVKRLSYVRHPDELGSAVCDLARYLCILQRFFPYLVKQIIPNLQQGLTVALQIITVELGTTSTGDDILEMMQAIFTTMSNPR